MRICGKLGDLSIVDDEAIGESSVSNNDKCNDVCLISNCDDLKQSSADGLVVVNGKGKVLVKETRLLSWPVMDGEVGR